MKQYSDEFDAYYDDETNEWLESKCDDPDCEYCPSRPDRPLPHFRTGDRVRVLPMDMYATVIKQNLHYDGSETFWGNIELEYDDGVKGVSNGWQCTKIL